MWYILGKHLTASPHCIKNVTAATEKQKKKKTCCGEIQEVARCSEMEIHYINIGSVYNTIVSTQM